MQCPWCPEEGVRAGVPGSCDLPDLVLGMDFQSSVTTAEPSVQPIGCSNLHFSVAKEENISFLFPSVCVFITEVPVKDFSPVFNQAFVSLWLSFKKSLYILDNSALSDICYANIFSQSVASLFSLLAISVEEQKILISTKSILSTLSPREQAFV